MLEVVNIIDSEVYKEGYLDSRWHPRRDVYCV